MTDMRALMEAVTLLEDPEARIDYIARTYRDQIIKHFRMNDLPESRLDYHIRNRVIGMLVIDPTPSKKYANWIVRMILSGKVREEDEFKLIQYLEVFDRAKSRIAQRDINAYRTLPDLYVAVKPFLEEEREVSSRAEKERLDREMRSPEHSEVIADNDAFSIVVPKTEEASCYFGRNTQWCTAATKSDNAFDSYNAMGPLYVILIKADNRRFQYHPQTDQLMNENDSPVSKEDFATHYPDIWAILAPIHDKRFGQEITKIDGTLTDDDGIDYKIKLKVYRNPSEKELRGLCALDSDNVCLGLISDSDMWVVEPIYWADMNETREAELVNQLRNAGAEGYAFTAIREALDARDGISTDYRTIGRNQIYLHVPAEHLKKAATAITGNPCLARLFVSGCRITLWRHHEDVPFDGFLFFVPGVGHRWYDNYQAFKHDVLTGQVFPKKNPRP